MSPIPGQKEEKMSQTPPTELAHRLNGGIEVTLLWHSDSDDLVLSVADSASGDAFAFEVESSTAVDAFYHPYAYAALFGIYFKPFPDPLPTASTLETGLSRA
jgi:hypothetical protein